LGTSIVDPSPTPGQPGGETNPTPTGTGGQPTKPGVGGVNTTPTLPATLAAPAPTLQGTPVLIPQTGGELSGPLGSLSLPQLLLNLGAGLLGLGLFLHGFSRRLGRALMKVN
jgi:hypothetical protein